MKFKVESLRLQKSKWGGERFTTVIFWWVLPILLIASSYFIGLELFKQKNVIIEDSSLPLCSSMMPEKKCRNQEGDVFVNIGEVGDLNIGKLGGHRNVAMQKTW